MRHKFTMGRPLTASLKEYGRGIAGGLLFSFPLLYTMEVWWAGFVAGPAEIITLTVVTYLLLLGYNTYAGMRKDMSWRSVAVDSMEEMGIGIIIAFLVLLMLNRIQLDGGMGLDEILGRVAIEAMAVSIGVSVGTAQLGIDTSKESHKGSGNGVQGRSRHSKFGTAVIALCGAILVGGNVAPTEEILVIAVEAKAVHVLCMVIVSLLLGVVVVYFSNFRGSAGPPSKHRAYSITYDACLSYAIALSSSAFILWFFGRFENVSFEIAFAQCVVLSVIAILGASAGRLLIK